MKRRRSGTPLPEDISRTYHKGRNAPDIKNIKDKYEEHHNVTYTDEALEACVKLADRYITDRNFPDKAIDALDEAGSRVHLTHVSVPKEIEDQEKQIDDMRMHKNEAVRLQNLSWPPASATVSASMKINWN